MPMPGYHWLLGMLNDFREFHQHEKFGMRRILILAKQFTSI